MFVHGQDLTSSSSSEVSTFCLQGGGPPVSTEEEGVREMLGKPRGRAGESEQDPN